MLSAEKRILSAYEAIPASASIMYALTKITFVLEEFEECLEYNKKILGYSQRKERRSWVKVYV